MGGTNKQCDAVLMGIEKEMVDWKIESCIRAKRDIFREIVGKKNGVDERDGVRTPKKWLVFLRQRIKTVGNRITASLANHL